MYGVNGNWCVTFRFVGTDVELVAFTLLLASIVRLGVHLFDRIDRVGFHPKVGIQTGALLAPGWS